MVPVSRIEMTHETEGDKKTPLPVRRLHVLADEDGGYPVGKLGGWELSVLDAELARANTVAWYRNPSSASKDALQVPWHDGHRWRSMQPDFLFFSTKAAGEVAASIVDPHGHHLGDALGKLIGLANFADKYGDGFLRIEAISKNEKGDLGASTKGTLRMLDLTDPRVRGIVRQSQTAVDAYREAGQTYE